MSLISVSVTGRSKGQKCVNTTDSGQVQVRADNELCLRVIGGQESRAPLSNSTNHPSLFLRLKLKTNSDKFCESVTLSMSITIFSPFKLDVAQLDQLPKISSNPKSILSTHSMKTRMKWEQDQTLQEEGQGKDGRGEVQVQEDGQGDMGVAQLCSLIC